MDPVLLTNPLVLVFGFLTLAGLGSGVAGLLSQWMKNRAALQMMEQKTRRLEAMSRMGEPAQERLLATMPDWLDPDDPDDIEAWKKARQETLKLGRSE